MKMTKQMTNDKLLMSDTLNLYLIQKKDHAIYYSFEFAWLFAFHSYFPWFNGLASWFEHDA